MVDEYQNWLDGLKVGDKVALFYQQYGTVDYSIVKVEKITPTRQIKLDGYSIKFKNGDMIDTSTWKTTTRRIVPITDEIRGFLEKKKLVAFIQKAEMDKLNIQQLRDIKKILEAV